MRGLWRPPILPPVLICLLPVDARRLTREQQTRSEWRWRRWRVPWFLCGDSEFRPSDRPAKASEFNGFDDARWFVLSAINGGVLSAPGAVSQPARFTWLPPTRRCMSCDRELPGSLVANPGIVRRGGNA